MGLVDGVTTNPTLIKKSGKDHEATMINGSIISVQFANT